MDILLEESPNWLWLKFKDVETKLAVREELQRRPPNYFMAPSFKVWQKTQGKFGWDGWLDFMQPWDSPKSGKVMRGLKDDVLEIAARLELKVQTKMIRSPFAGLVADDVPADLLCGLELDHNQQEAIAGMLSDCVGVIEATVSAGKTAIFLGCVQLCKRQMPSAKWLYVVPSERLANQVSKEAAKLAPDLRVSQFGGGKRDMDGEDLVIATIASLSVNIEELVSTKWMRGFHGLICDEVHRSTSPTAMKVMQAVPAFFRVGGSDSVKDQRRVDEIKGMTIRGLFGPVKHRIRAEHLIDIGRLAKPHIYLVDIPEWKGRYNETPIVAEPGTRAWCWDDATSTWTKGTYKGPAPLRDADGKIKTDKKGNQIDKLNTHLVSFAETGVVEWSSRWTMLKRRYEEAIMRFRERNELIVQWANHWATKGPDWPTLVVCTRTLHVMILETMLQGVGLEVKTLTSEHTPKERDAVFAWMTERHSGASGRVLVTPLVKEGVSLPELRAGVVADYVAGPDPMRQILGRFIRKKPTGENHAHITVFVENQCRTYHKGSQALIKELERLRGYAYHWPCAGPNTADSATVFDAAADQ